MTTSTKSFTIEEKLKSLVRLQKIDSKLDEAKYIKGQLPDEVRELEDQIQGLDARKLRVEEEINGIKDYVQSAKVKIDESQQLITKYEKQSKNVRNNREFVALNNEIEAQGIEIKILERKIKAAGEDFDTKTQSVLSRNEEIENKKAILVQKNQELQKVIASTEKEEKELQEKAKIARSKIEERLLYTYDKVRKTYSNGLAVAVVEREACGGCFQFIPPQKQSEISLKKRLILCENCGRILVDKETMDQLDV